MYTIPTPARSGIDRKLLASYRQLTREEVIPVLGHHNICQVRYWEQIEKVLFKIPIPYPERINGNDSRLSIPNTMSSAQRNILSY